VLLSYTLAELQQNLFSDYPKFRAAQLMQAVYQQKALRAADIQVWPAALRAEFTQPNFFTSKVVKTLKEGKQAKFILELADAHRIECVLLVDKKDRKTACLSSQVGCAMGCTFCKTGTLGIRRNLTTGEIIEQFLIMKNYADGIDNVVFMGMGEPTANLQSVLKTISILGSKETLQMSQRRFTISTCGIVSGIKAIADANHQVGLAFSLVSADEQKRPLLMPTAKKNSLPDIKAALKYYQEVGGRRITFEVALLPNYNMDREDAKKIAAFGKGLDYIVNLIPWNPVEGLPYTRPSEGEVEWFQRWLEDYGVETTRRYRRAATIGGACGQLGE
jgi:23S rRNA (adenine2503-C2)-methyltransferase